MNAALSSGVAIDLLEEWVSFSGFQSQADPANDRGMRRSEFAAGVEPIVRGMLALARSRHRLAHHGNASKMSVVFSDPCHRSVSRVCVENVTPSVMTEARPLHGEEFGPNERLGLRCLTLRACTKTMYHPVMAELGFVLPSTARSEWLPRDPNGFVFATVDLLGNTASHLIAPVPLGDSFLRARLGLYDASKPFDRMQRQEGTFEEFVAFPGSLDYFADAMPRIAEYLESLAQIIAAE